MSHTPGPWSVHSYSQDEHVIPEVWGRPGGELSDHISRIEDARLIAAAPELLAALDYVASHRAEVPTHIADVCAIAAKKARNA